MNSLRSLIVIFCLCIFSLSVFGQSPTSPSTESEQEKQKKEQELEQKALAMLDELIGAGRSFRLPENRCHIFATAGGLLWRHDEKRARELLREAMNMIINLTRQPEESPDALPENVRWQIWDLRRQIVEVLAQNDPQLADEFLRSSRPPAEMQDRSFNAGNEPYLEGLIARQFALKDPQRALQLAEEALAAGKNLNNLLNVITTLREKDFDAAKKLTDLVIAKLQSETPLSVDSCRFVLNLTRYAPQPNESEESAAKRKALLTAATARALIEKAIISAQTALVAAKQKNDKNQRHNVINWLKNSKSSTAYLEKNAPASLALLKRSWAEMEQVMDPGQRNWEALNKLAEKGSVEALLEAAAKAPPEMRQGYFQRAAQMANQQGNTERARQIINDNYPDKTQRQYALQEIDRQLLWKKLGENKFDEVRKLMPKFRSAQEQVGTLVSIAQSLQGAGKKEMAQELLNEAWELVGGPIESSTQFFSQLQIAGGYIYLNPARSFEIIEASLEQFNELFAAAATLESFEPQGTFRSKEMVLRNGGRMNPYLQSYSQHLLVLSTTDPDRAASLISRFARPEVRACLQLSILSQLLNRRRGV